MFLSLFIENKLKKSKTAITKKNPQKYSNNSINILPHVYKILIHI